MNFSNLIGLVTHQSSNRTGNATPSADLLAGSLERLRMHFLFELIAVQACCSDELWGEPELSISRDIRVKFDEAQGSEDVGALR
eukprot:s3470_g2.t1